MAPLIRHAGACHTRLLRRRQTQSALLHIQRRYPDAINALNSLQSNFAIVDELRKKGQFLNKLAIPEMIEWWRRAGYQQSDLNKLNVVHVAGTKGKGSTATFVSSILDQYRQAGQLGGTGLYTSPHLRHVRERIQIDGQPISEEEFSESFFELWDRFEAAEQTDTRESNAEVKPKYFRYLTLMAFHTYLKQGVENPVIECGIGGEYDSTNIIPLPTVTAITSIGLDHVDMLGRTIGEIAWHKAGIMKAGAAAYTSPQAPEALEVLRARAQERGVDLQVVEEHPELTANHVHLGLAGSFQKMNASLAVEAAAAHLRHKGHKDLRTDYLPVEFISGLERAHLGGRCETRDEGKIAWHLDGAHTAESMQGAAQWFGECVATDRADKPRVLIFNQQTRDAPKLLGDLHRTLAKQLGSGPKFSHVIFCANRTFQTAGYSADLVSLNSDTQAVGSLRVQEGLADAWRALEEGDESMRPRADVAVLGSIEEAVALARRIVSSADQAGGNMPGDEKIHVLITGSVHLVGGALEVLETEVQTRT